MDFRIWLEDREEQYDKATKALMALHYTGIDIAKATDEEIFRALQSLGKTPNHVSPTLFAAQMRSIANGQFDPDQDLKRRRNEKEMEELMAPRPPLKTVCPRCGEKGTVSRFEWGAGKAYCQKCGSKLHLDR